MPASARAQSFNEGFDNITTLSAAGWSMQNNSEPVGITNWFQGTVDAGTFAAQSGATNSYIGANYNNAAGAGTISNWLLTPNRTFNNGDTFSFYTRKATPNPNDYPDRLQVRLSTNGASTNVGIGGTAVGDFTTLLLDINPTLVAGGYPVNWTQYTVTISGLSGSTSGRLALRYFVTNGGPNGSNSDYIGIDTVSYVANAVPVLGTVTATPTTLNEGASTTVNGSFTDADAANTHVVTINWGDGSTNTTLNPAAGDTTFNTTHTYADDAAAGTATDTYTITVTVADNGGATDSDNSNSITVSNVAPTATFSNGGTVSVGSTGMVSFSGQSDVAADVAAGLRYAFDFNNDGDFADTDEIGDGTYAGSVTDATATVPASYLSTPGSYTIRGRILDKDTGFTDYTTSITVNEIPSLIVTTTQDVIDATDGLISLREAVILANADGDASTITFDIAGAGPHIVQLNSAMPNLSTAITINGPANEKVTVRGEGEADAYQMFYVASGVTVEMSLLTFSNGRATGGFPANVGGALRNLGTLTLTSCTFTGNHSNGGGAVANNGTLTVVGCTFASNTAAHFGGALYNQSGTTTLTNSTFAANSAAVGGSGIFNENGATLHIQNCTIAGNNAGSGLSDNGGTTHLTNSIVSGNAGGNVSGTLATDDHNIIAVDAELAPLADNGGPTQTMALEYGSPAINAGNNAAAPATDQRGLTRPVGQVDIGAFEVQATYLIRGYIRTSNLSPVAGVSVKLATASGNAGAAVTTDSTGLYQFNVVPAGGYLVTPTLAGWSFSPAAQSIVVSNASRGANFVATRNAATYSVSGRISNSSGAALPGVSVALAPTRGGVLNPVTTNSAGYYTFSNVPAGSYSLTPTMGGFTFTPAMRTIEVSAADVSAQNFVAHSGYTITGRVATSRGIGISGVSVQLDGGVTVLTNSAGYYTLRDVADGPHTLTASKTDYSFTPSPRTVEVNGANVAGQNFTGTGP